MTEQKTFSAANGNEIRNIEGKWYDDYGIEYASCYDCEDYHPIEDMILTVNGLVCQNCLDEYYGFCERCNEYHHLDNIYEVFCFPWVPLSELMCADCAQAVATFCDECGGFFRDGVYRVDSGSSCLGLDLCQSCMESTNIEICCECGSVGDNVEYDDTEENYFCPNCARSLALSNYHQTRNLAWLGNYNELHMGVELEIDGAGEDICAARTLRNLLGENYCECKRDSSLMEGFEFASSPATYEAHATELGWREMMSEAINLGYRSHDTDTCGLHIHVDRSYFGDRFESEYEDKIAMLFANNVEWIRTFSRRRRFNYCEITDNMSKTTTPEQAKEKNYQSKPDKNRRYAAINYSTGINTVEFRIFKGTLNYSTFLATLQFVQMFCDFVRDLSPEALAYVGMYRFIQESKDRGFTEFTTYLKKRGLM